MPIIIIDNDNIEEVENKEVRIKHNRKQLKERKDMLKIRRELDKAEMDEIDLLLAKFN